MNMDKTTNRFLTPKKRPANKQAKNQLSCLQKARLKLNYIDALYFHHHRPKLPVQATPKSRRISQSLEPSAYSIKNENTNEIFDIKHEIHSLKKLQEEEEDILGKIHLKWSSRYSHIDIQYLDRKQNELSSEKNIYRFPKLFEVKGSLKFVSQILISRSRLSEIYLCQHRFDEQFYVAKVGSPSGTNHLSSTSMEIVNELKILTIIGKHPHMVDYSDAWVEDERFYLQIPFVGGGSLHDFLMGHTEVACLSDSDTDGKTNKLTVESAYILIAHISSLLVYMHDVLRIFHGDIKPSNILIDLLRYSSNDLAYAKKECHDILLGISNNKRLRFKLCDFGRSGPTDLKIFNDGDGRYLSYELNCPTKHVDSTARDVFSLGMTLYACLGGTVNEEAISKVSKGDLSELPESISDDLRNIITKMTTANGTMRTTSRKITEIDKVKTWILPEALDYFIHDGVSPADVKETPPNHHFD